MKPTALVVTGAEVFAPEPMGVTDMVVLGERICSLGGGSDLPSWAHREQLDATGKRIFPGLIDLHVHIAGGGGEGGPWFRTPEIALTQLSTVGITTVVGVLGTDGTTRSVPELLAKARALEAEGIHAWIYTGAYEVPTRTITQSARDDIVLIDKVIGIGEIAISDFRGSHPDGWELARLAGEARVGGLLSGKAGILHLHVGDGSGHLTPIFRMLDRADIPIDSLLPTHLNRSPDLLKDAIRFARAGGWVDITTGIYPEPHDKLAIEPARAVVTLLEAGIPLERITMSSDAQGSSPLFNQQGHLIKMGIGKADTLWQAVVALHRQYGLPWEQAVAPVTAAAAHVLRLKDAGKLKVGSMADFIVVDRDSDRIEWVIAKGKVLVQNGSAVAKGMFEPADESTMHSVDPNR